MSALENYDAINAKDKPETEDFTYAYVENLEGGFRKIYKEKLKTLLNGELEGQLTNKVTNPTTGEVGQILEIETVSDEGKPLTYKAVDKPTGGGEGGTQIQADWSQNDDTQMDYVKNRPFYSEYEEQEILAETTYTLADVNEDSGIIVVGALSLVEGQTYVVNYNGIDYSCVYYHPNSLTVGALGNESLVVEGEDTGEPFVFANDEDGSTYGTPMTVLAPKDIVDGTATESSTWTVSIKQIEEIVHQIPEKYVGSGEIFTFNFNEDCTEIDVSFDDLWDACNEGKFVVGRHFGYRNNGWYILNTIYENNSILKRSLSFGVNRSVYHSSSYYEIEITHYGGDESCDIKYKAHSDKIPTISDSFSKESEGALTNRVITARFEGIDENLVTLNKADSIIKSITELSGSELLNVDESVLQNPSIEDTLYKVSEFTPTKEYLERGVYLVAGDGEETVEQKVEGTITEEDGMIMFIFNDVPLLVILPNDIKIEVEEGVFNNYPKGTYVLPPTFFEQASYSIRIEGFVFGNYVIKEECIPSIDVNLTGYVTDEELSAEVSSQLDGAKADIVTEVIAQLGGMPVFGTVNDDNTITVTSALAEGNYTLYYEDADGNREQIGEITYGDITVDYTNLYDASTMAVDTYMNKRINSSGEYADATNYFSTPFIKIPNTSVNDLVIRVKNAYFDMATTNSTTSYARVLVYNGASHANILDIGTSGNPVIADNGWNATYDDATGVYTFKPNKTLDATASHLRITAYAENGATASNLEDVVITVNEEI